MWMRGAAEYWTLAKESTAGYFRYLVRDITEPSAHSYFYLLLGVTAAFLIWERANPWRRQQRFVREDFFLDAFYLFFNFFGFSLIGFAAVSDVAQAVTTDGLAAVGIENLVAVSVASLPVAAQLVLMFVLRDFIHYFIHRLLHRAPWLWRFHQVHHSVREMGVAAHLRFHWMETVVYRALEFIPLSLFGFGIDDFFFVHAISLSIGHFNHSNVRLPLGPLRYIFNSPQMHIWHHARVLTPGARTGRNFGLSLSLWDYLFGTADVPNDGRDEELGFDGIDSYPRGLFSQMVEPFRR